MNLNMYIIFDELNSYNPKHNLPYKNIADDAFTISHYKILTGDNTYFEETTLYLVSEKIFCQYNDSDFSENMNFLILGNDYIDIQDLSYHCISVKDNYTLIEMSNILSEIFNKYNKWDQKLMNALCNECTLYHFFDLCVDILENPFFVMDTIGVILYVGGNIPRKIEGTYFEFILPNMCFLYENQIPNKLERIPEFFLFRKHAYLVTDEKFFRPFISYNLFINGDRYGEIVLNNTSKSFTIGEMYLLEHIGKRATTLIEKQGNIYSKDSSTHIINQLLNGEELSTEIIEYQLMKKKWKYNDPYYVLQIKNLENEVNLLKLSTSHIKQTFPQSIMVYHNNSIICIIRDLKNSQINQKNLNHLKEYSKKLDLKIGLSMLFHNFFDLELAFSQAKAAIELGITIDPNGIVFEYKNYYFKHLVNSLTSGISLKTYCDPQIIQLKKYDDKNNSELFYTLLTFLKNRQSLVETSKKLYIHRNTLVKRMNKIEDILDVNIKDISTEHTLISCMLIEEI